MLNINKIVEADRILEIQREVAIVRNTGDAKRCMYKHHAKHRGEFRRDLRQGNPDCVCLACDGYDEELSCYIPRQ